MSVSRLAVRALLLVALIGLVAGDALAARRLRATGFYRMSFGQLNIPLQFVGSAPGNTGMHSIPFGFPNGDPMASGGVSVQGSNPATLSLPQHLVNGTYSALLPLDGTDNVQLSSMFGVRAPETVGGAMFSAGAGPGSFSFCPGTLPGLPGAACPTTLGSPGTGFMQGGAPNLMASPQGTGTRNGRLIYMGGNGFGGVSRMFIFGTGEVVSVRSGFGFGSPIFQAGHRPLGGSTLRVTGGMSGTFVSQVIGNNVTFTQPKTQPTTMGIITAAQAGPQVTSMNALTSCPATPMGGSFPNIPLTGTLACVTGIGPPLITADDPETITGFPFTTGTVIAQHTENGTDLFTVTGSDTRTPLGVGNISMVAGGLREDPEGGQAAVHTIKLTLAEKTPSMTPSGLGAAALLMLIGAGYAMRHRF